MRRRLDAITVPHFHSMRETGEIYGNGVGIFSALLAFARRGRCSNLLGTAAVSFVRDNFSARAIAGGEQRNRLSFRRRLS
jgi:hypothetical protein